MGSVAGAVDSRQVSLRNGSIVTIGPLVAGDEVAIAEWFAGLGPETRYARFLAEVTDLDRRTQAELARVDHRDHEAIAAVGPDGVTIGIARYARVREPGTAEVAVAVADDWRGLSIASILLGEIATRAREAGIETFTAMCLASNARVIRLLSRLGSTTVSVPDVGVVEVRIDLVGGSA